MTSVRRGMQTTRVRPRLRARCGVLVAGILSSAVLQAQAAPCPTIADSVGGWSAPLDRLVMQPSAGLSLRAALDDVAARAQVRLSYSTEALPLDREACIVSRPMALGSALRALLYDVRVQPVASGVTQVALAPTAAAPTLARTVARLDRVLVTGSAVGASERPLPYAVDVVRGSELRGGGGPTGGEAGGGSVA
jgi:hypothetical protein